jgi:hypothetical protein
MHPSFTQMNFIKTCLAVAYLTKILLYEEKESHFGPFPSKTKIVHDLQSRYTQPVTLFDWIRRLTLNPYNIQGELWVVNEKEMERWTCPTCLSFWIAIPFTVLNILRTRQIDEQTIITHFAISFVSSFLNYLVNYVQMRTQEEEISNSV